MKHRSGWQSSVVMALIFMALGWANGALAQDPAVDRLLASQCAQCHGTNGYAVGEFESIAGEEAKDMYEDLTDMKGEDKPENIMDHQALGYTDDQIRRIARYYAGFPEEQGKVEDTEKREQAQEEEEREEEREEEEEEEEAGK